MEVMGSGCAVEVMVGRCARVAGCARVTAGGRVARCGGPERAIWVEAGRASAGGAG